MKLILAIIQDEDAHEVIGALNDAKFQVTRLNTKGGCACGKSGRSSENH